MTRLFSIGVLAACLVAFAFTDTAEAARSRSKTQSINGTFDGVITRLNRSQMSFEVGNDNVKKYTVNYDLDTAVTGGGKQGTLDDLAVGQSVKVTVKSNRATKIEVQVKK